MKTKTNLTLNQIIEWAKNNNISFDTPIVCHCANYETHFDACGIVYETDAEWDETNNDIVGGHCYCKDGDIEPNTIVITDGYHYRDN